MESKSLKERMDEKMQEWKAKAEEMEVQLNLGKMEAEEGIEDAKKELKEKLHETRSKMEKAKEVAEDKWEDFAEEVTEGFTHIGAGLKKLFS